MLVAMIQTKFSKWQTAKPIVDCQSSFSVKQPELNESNQ